MSQYRYEAFTRAFEDQTKPNQRLRVNIIGLKISPSPNHDPRIQCPATVVLLEHAQRVDIQLVYLGEVD